MAEHAGEDIFWKSEKCRKSKPQRSEREHMSSDEAPPQLFDIIKVQRKEKRWGNIKASPSLFRFIRTQWSFRQIWSYAGFWCAQNERNGISRIMQYSLCSAPFLWKPMRIRKGEVTRLKTAKRAWFDDTAKKRAALLKKLSKMHIRTLKNAFLLYYHWCKQNDFSLTY